MNRLNFLIALACILLLSSPVYSQTDVIVDDGKFKVNTITTSVPFLIIDPDAKAGGMGDVGVATNPDAMSMHWNPANMSFVDDDLGFSICYTPWLSALVSDINLSYLTAYKRLNKNEVLGFH